MKLATKVVVVALTATALCGVGVGTASAATPEGSHSVSAAATTTDAPTTTVVAYQRGISRGDAVDRPGFACPLRPTVVGQRGHVAQPDTISKSNGGLQDWIDEALARMKAYPGCLASGGSSAR